MDILIRNKFSSLICYGLLSSLCFTAQASCNNQPITVTKISGINWTNANDKDEGTKQVMSSSGSGGLIKLGPGYKHEHHYYPSEATVLVVDGTVDITSNGKTISVAKGDVIHTPDHACYSTSSKKGALIAMFGASPGQSKKENE